MNTELGFLSGMEPKYPYLVKNQIKHKRNFRNKGVKKEQHKNRF
jgi:hypothetical protein